MALSNWDTLAINHLGEPVNGIFDSPSGVQVQFYKNWIYVRDAKAWEPNTGWAEPTIAMIEFGSLSYKDVHIEAWRCGHQSGVCAAIWSGYGKDLTGMVGCGVYGFADHTWVGVSQDTLEALQFGLRENTAIPTALADVDFSKALRFNQGDALFCAKRRARRRPRYAGR